MKSGFLEVGIYSFLGTGNMQKNKKMVHIERT
jgi:hypothetical protein